MKNIIEEQIVVRDLLLSGHPDQRGLCSAVSDWVGEEVFAYHTFLARKRFYQPDSGFECGDLNPHLFDWQTPIVRWVLRKGKASIFADCGLGKTLMQLEWASELVRKFGFRVLIQAPLAVAEQTLEEGDKFGIPVRVCRDQSQVRDGINITNYEMLHAFDPQSFGGVVLDESSILKDHTSSTRKTIRSACWISH